MKKTVGSILVVDDDELIRFINKTVLEGGGHTVVCVSSGEDAAQIVALKPDMFEVILIDYHMGNGMDGIAATKEIRRFADRDKVVVVLTTAQSNISQEDFEEYYKQGVDAYLPKPLDTTALLANVTLYIQARRSRAAEGSKD